MYATRAGRPSCRSLSNRPLILLVITAIELLQIFAIDIDVFVPAPREIHDEDLAPCRRRAPDRLCYRMRRLKRRDDALRPGQQRGPFDPIILRARHITAAPLLAQP